MPVKQLCDKKLKISKEEGHIPHFLTMANKPKKVSLGLENVKLCMDALLQCYIFSIQ
jgi:hypothetical protein